MNKYEKPIGAISSNGEDFILTVRLGKTEDGNSNPIFTEISPSNISNLILTQSIDNIFCYGQLSFINSSDDKVNEIVSSKYLKLFILLQRWDTPNGRVTGIPLSIQLSVTDVSVSSSNNCKGLIYTLNFISYHYINALKTLPGISTPPILGLPVLTAIKYLAQTANIPFDEEEAKNLVTQQDTTINYITNVNDSFITAYNYIMSHLPPPPDPSGLLFVRHDFSTDLLTPYRISNNIDTTKRADIIPVSTIGLVDDNAGIPMIKTDTEFAFNNSMNFLDLYRTMSPVVETHYNYNKNTIEKNYINSSIFATNSIADGTPAYDTSLLVKDNIEYNNLWYDNFTRFTSVNPNSSDNFYSRILKSLVGNTSFNVNTVLDFTNIPGDYILINAIPQNTVAENADLQFFLKTFAGGYLITSCSIIINSKNIYNNLRLLKVFSHDRN